MPIYEYKCKDCGYQFEIKQRITEDALTECPKCGGRIERMIFGAGIVFKGNGYYTTDYVMKNSDNNK